jgi:hypothetical protein
MLKRISIFFAIIVLIIAIGFGFYIIVGDRLSGKKNSSAGSEKEPHIKLVYVGTNETLSEALYHLDLQDGKLDESHIVHKILETDPKSEISDIKKQALLFIGKDGKVKKEEVFESKPSKVVIYITRDGKYAMVFSDFTDVTYTVRYYDVNGELLWIEKDTTNSYSFSPDGKIIIEEIPTSKGKQYNIFNYRKQLIKGRFYEVDFSKEKGGYYPEKDVLFSPRTSYFILRHSFTNNKSLFALFDKNGNILYLRRINGFIIENQEDKLSDEGDYYYVGYDLKTFRKKITTYDKSGKEKP